MSGAASGGRGRKSQEIKIGARKWAPADLAGGRAKLLGEALAQVERRRRGILEDLLEPLELLGGDAPPRDGELGPLTLLRLADHLALGGGPRRLLRGRRRGGLTRGGLIPLRGEDQLLELVNTLLGCTWSGERFPGEAQARLERGFSLGFFGLRHRQ